MVALNQDLVISALEIVSPLFHCLDNRQELPIVRVFVLSGGRPFSRVEIDWARLPNPSYWLRMPAIAKPLASVCRMIGFCGLKCWRIGALVKAFFSF